ncbi:hypothetical protein QE152_g33477 [Popillia japonica]|uniref:Craniofacial development protein 2-like n=1 Tax=Popillia japonica TaxID=7064 RepID=A0AAW1IX14_POPJA
MGTWNLQGINEQGAVKTLIKELKQYKVDILETHLKEVQETHLKEKSVQEVDEYILYNSGGNDRRFGVGFAVNKNLAARVKRF